MLKSIIKITIKFLVIVVLIHLIVLFIVGFQNTKENADVILVLGNKVEENGEPSERLSSRLDEALYLYNEGIAQSIVVSGGTGKTGFDEAEVMKEYLVKRGVDSELIIEDPDGTKTYNTAKNMRTIANNMGYEKVIIVSQYFHILRTRLALNKFGFKDLQSSNAKIGPGLRDLYSIPREIIGFYYYFFRY